MNRTGSKRINLQQYFIYNRNRENNVIIIFFTTKPVLSSIVTNKLSNTPNIFPAQFFNFTERHN